MIVDQGSVQQGSQDSAKTETPMTFNAVVDTIAYKTGLRDRYEGRRFNQNPFHGGGPGCKPWVDMWAQGWQDAGRLAKNAYNDGISAKIRGAGVDACTFEEDTFGRSCWLKGWMDTEVNYIHDLQDWLDPGSRFG